MASEPQQLQAVLVEPDPEPSPAVPFAGDDIWAKGDFSLPQFSHTHMVNRDRLVSAMLQDRNSLRLISAPHGYGKTWLAYQYAHRLYRAGDVLWVECGTPEFLRALDEPSSASLLPKGSQDIALVVFDDVPHMDWRRQDAFSRQVGTLISQGIEVVVTLVPSRDFLRNTFGNCTLITAGDLLVQERDMRGVSLSGFDAKAAKAKETWSLSKASLFGLAPCSVWGTSEKVDLENLAGFFGEVLPLGSLEAAFTMFVLVNGELADLDESGVLLGHDGEIFLAQNYPLLGLDLVKRTFKTGEVPIKKLAEAAVEAGVGNRLLGSQRSYRHCVERLIRAGRADRAAEAMDILFNSEQRLSWLEERGWELLDAGELRLLEAQLRLCEDESPSIGKKLQVLHAWLSGLSGEKREAAYYARSALKVAPAKEGLVELMSYVALLAFSEGGPLICSKGSYAPDMIESPGDFLAAVVDLSEEAEIVRSLSVLEGNLAPAVSSRSAFPKPSQERVEALETLFTSYADQFQSSVEFRVALHLLAGMNSPQIKELVYALGGDLMISLRKKGVKTFTQGIVVSDLWRSGFFGLTGGNRDLKDCRLLDSAAASLTRLLRMSGKEPASIPWDAGVHTSNIGKRAPAAKKKNTAKVKVEDNAPVANVTLFGGLEVIIGDRYISGAQWSHRSMQLFAMLVMALGRDVARETIYKNMWPDLDRTRAQDNFYSAWSRAQTLLGEGPYLMRRGEFCGINTRYVVSDVAEFEQLVRRLLTERDDTSTILDLYARMEAIYRGGLLPGETGNSFINNRRDNYRATFVDGMVAASHRSLEMRDARIALWFARKAMEEDDKREDVFYAMIRAQIASGQRCTAIRTFFKCKEFLREELGLDPSLDTQNLYSELIATDPSLERLKPTNFSK